MCLFKIKKIYYENLRLSSELKRQKELCQHLEYDKRQLRAEIDKYKNQQELIRKYEIQIKDMESALQMFASGEVDDDAFVCFVNGGYKLEDLISFKEKQCSHLKSKDIENLKLQPITLDDTIR